MIPSCTRVCATWLSVARIEPIRRPLKLGALCEEISRSEIYDAGARSLSERLPTVALALTRTPFKTACCCILLPSQVYSLVTRDRRETYCSSW